MRRIVILLYYTDHLIHGQYHCLEIDMEKKRRKNAVLFVFGGGMILGSCRKRDASLLCTAILHFRLQTCL